jgi:hypothetical protein
MSASVNLGGYDAVELTDAISKGPDTSNEDKEVLEGLCLRDKTQNAHNEQSKRADDNRAED